MAAVSLAIGTLDPRSCLKDAEQQQRRDSIKGIGMNENVVTGHTRTSMTGWLEEAVTLWSSIVMATLNFKTSLFTDAGVALRIDDEKARSQVKRFGGEVDRAAFGSRTVQRFNRRVQRIPFLEYGNDRG